MLADQDATRGFTDRLVKQAVAQKSGAVIMEIKRASPSKGLLRADFQPELHAQQYETAGASCLSILTDQDFFKDLMMIYRRHERMQSPSDPKGFYGGSLPDSLNRESWVRIVFY